MGVCGYIYIYIYTYIYTHTYTYVCNRKIIFFITLKTKCAIFDDLCSPIPTSTKGNQHVCNNTSIYIHTYIHTYIHAQVMQYKTEISNRMLRLQEEKEKEQQELKQRAVSYIVKSHMLS